MLFGWLICAIYVVIGLADDKLLAKAKNGDSESLEQLLESHRLPLTRWLMKSWYAKLSSDEVEDAVQDCFRKLCLGIGKLEIRSSFKAYLYAAARSECLTILRKNSRHGDDVSIDAAAEDTSDDNTTSSLSIDGKKYREIPDPNAPDQDQTVMNIDLRRALASLSPTERLYIKMAIQDQISVSDISRITGHSYFIVYRSIQKTLPRLKNILESYDSCKNVGEYNANRVGGNVK